MVDYGSAIRPHRTERNVMMTEKTLGLYLHIPFCQSKCPYCDFHSDTDTSMASRYTEALLLHMEDYARAAAAHDVDTVFFGGGTPTVLPVNRLIAILEGIEDVFHLRNDAEITVEANPATVTLSELKRLRRAGVNRLSMGLQSANDDELAALGRIHTFDDFVDSFCAARKAGFHNISVDLMYGIPGQTLDSFRRTLQEVVALEPEHISVYGLKIEEGTPFADRKDSLNLPDEDTESEMYFEAIRLLADAGYAQYEISNFAKPGKQCLHNLRYWNCEEYLGFGPGAHSYFGGRRFAFRRSTEDYVRAMEYPGSVSDLLSEDYEVHPSERLGEYVMLRMRLTEGVDTDAFSSLFGVSFEKLFAKYLNLYASHGFMEKSGRRWHFTPKGMYVSNYILSAMLDFDSDILSGIADGSDR
ncbi:MAG: radical SAM family heme chaperone HemW [Ruminococcaceae bacterium]|nr:radical SAM family heme chaperone HemW [Oscillospiraceae bacterium]